MKSVINQLLESRNDSARKQLSDSVNCTIEKTDVSDVVPPRLLDSLLKAELGCMQITKGYEYAIYNQKNSRFYFGNFNLFKNELLASEHKQSIKSLFSPGDYYLSLYFPRQKNMVIKQLIGWMLLSVVFLLVIIFSFWYTILTIIRQKNISEMKNDFINNMTHEFKTPIATISLASEMLMKPAIQLSQQKTAKYAGVIFQENQRLQSQVEQVLQIALQKCLDRFELQLKERSGKASLSAKAIHFHVIADEYHMFHVFSNLIDNAIKYSPEAPLISISTISDQNGIIIRFTDQEMYMT